MGAWLRKWVSAFLIVLGVAGGAGALCTGDCDNSLAVDISELVRCVNIALENVPLTACPACDSNGNGQVEINELIKAVNSALDGCPAVLPTATPTITRTPTVTPTCPTTGCAPGECCFDSRAGCNNQSELELCAATFGGCGAVKLPINGALRLTCDEGAGTDVVRDCECELIRFDPVEIVGIGFVCAEDPSLRDPEFVCPVGKADCPGGSQLGNNLEAYAQIGACENPAECLTMCEAHCASVNKAVFDSGCELFCEGGDRDGLPCECDRLGTAACSLPPPAPPPTLECPDGSCVGKDLEFDRDCQCTCIDEPTGPPVPAGALSCRLPVGIRVEITLPCDRVDILVNLPPLCAPLTSATSTGVILGSNEFPDDQIGPRELIGQSAQCTDVDASRLGALTLVTNLAFFDSTIGDLLTPMTFDCFGE